MRVLRFLEGFSGVFASVFEFFFLVGFLFSHSTQRELHLVPPFPGQEKFDGGKLWMCKLGGWMARQKDASNDPDDIPLTKLSLCISMIQ